VCPTTPDSVNCSCAHRWWRFRRGCSRACNYGELDRGDWAAVLLTGSSSSSSSNKSWHGGGGGCCRHHRDAFLLHPIVSRVVALVLHPPCRLPLLLLLRRVAARVLRASGVHWRPFASLSPAEVVRHSSEQQRDQQPNGDDYGRHQHSGVSCTGTRSGDRITDRKERNTLRTVDRAVRAIQAGRANRLTRRVLVLARLTRLLHAAHTLAARWTQRDGSARGVGML